MMSGGRGKWRRFFHFHLISFRDNVYLNARNEGFSLEHTFPNDCLSVFNEIKLKRHAMWVIIDPSDNRA